MKNASQAIQQKDYAKAANLLLTAKNAFPHNLEIRLKLFDFYQMTNNIDALLNEGIELLQIYKEEKKDEQYNALFDKLTA